jgi:uncharacterized repeat protein (TIGR01451 family)
MEERLMLAVSDLAVSISPSPDTVVAGSNLTYAITVVNNGPDAATGVSLTDTLPAGATFVSATPSQGTVSQSSGVVSLSVSSLANGGSATLTIVVQPQSAGTITDSASVAANESDPNLTNNTATAQTTVTAAADLAVSITDNPDPVAVGSALVYTVIVTNNGPSGATGVVLTDTLPGTATFGSFLVSQGSASQSAGVVTANLGDLAKGATASLTITVTPTVTGTITDSAGVTANETDPTTSNNSASVQTLVTGPTDLAIALTGGPNPVLAGANLTYILNVTNNGPNGATGVTVTDTLPAGLTLISATTDQGTVSVANGIVTANIGNMLNGAHAIVTIIVQPTTAGTVTDSASVLGHEGDPNPTNNSATVQTTVKPAADLGLTLVPSPNPALLGSDLTLTIVVTNFGPSFATNVTLVDSLLSAASIVSATSSQGSVSISNTSVSVSLGTMAPGATATVTIVVRPTSLGNLEDTASVSATEPDPNTVNNTVTTLTPVNPAADLSVSIGDSPDPVPVGSNLSYTVSVANHGPSPATGVSLTDTLPAGVTIVSITPSQGSDSVANGVITTNLGSLAAGASATLTIIVTPQTPGTLTDTAHVTANEADPNTANNSASQSTTVLASVDIGVTMSGAPNPVNAGSNLTYSLVVTNNSATAATGVNLNDALPAGVTFFSVNESQGTAMPAGGNVFVNLGKLAPHATASVTIVVTPTAGGTITNTATVTENEADPNPANNTATTQTTVTGVADLGVTVSGLPNPALLGNKLTYTVTVTNTGPSAASGVALSDTLPAGVTFVSATPSQGTATQSAGKVTGNLGSIASGASATVTIVVTPTAIGSVTDSATVTANEADPNPSNNAANQTIQVVPAADLQATMSALPTTGLKGQNLTFTVTVTNLGPSTATSVDLADVLPAGASFVSDHASQGTIAQFGNTLHVAMGTMLSGASATFSLVVSPTSAPESVTNTASVLANEADPNTANNSVSQTVPVTDAPGTLALSNATFSVKENAGSLQITVNRTGGNGGAVSVHYATTDGTAHAGSNYTLTSGTLNFANLVTSGTITIPILVDHHYSPNLSFTLALSSPTGGASLGAMASATITIVETDHGTIGDYDGDGKTDIALYRPTTDQWMILRSSAGPQLVNFGMPGDIPVPGDYSGDGKTELAVYVPSTAEWFIQGMGRVQFGAPGDIPVPGDYDGDGKTDIAVYHPATAQWFILRSTAGPEAISFGAPNLDIPVPGDYDGDGKTDIAVFRPTTDQWMILQSTAGPRLVQFGAPGLDVPIPADYDGDGKTDIAVFRPTTDQWLILQSSKGPRLAQFGAIGDIPVPNDYFGTGAATIAVYRPATAQWVINQPNDGAELIPFGGPGLDMPLPTPLAYRFNGRMGRSAGRSQSFGSGLVTASAVRTMGTASVASSSANDFLVIIPPTAPPSVPSADSATSSPRTLRHDLALEALLGSS